MKSRNTGPLSKDQNQINININNFSSKPVNLTINNYNTMNLTTNAIDNQNFKTIKASGMSMAGSLKGSPVRK